MAENKKVVKLRERRKEIKTETFRELWKDQADHREEMFAALDEVREMDFAEFSLCIIEFLKGLLEYVDRSHESRDLTIIENFDRITEEMDVVAHNFTTFEERVHSMGHVIFAQCMSEAFLRGRPPNMEQRKGLVEQLGFNWERTCENFGWPVEATGEGQPKR